MGTDTLVWRAVGRGLLCVGFTPHHPSWGGGRIPKRSTAGHLRFTPPFTHTHRLIPPSIHRPPRHPRHKFRPKRLYALPIARHVRFASTRAHRAFRCAPRVSVCLHSSAFPVDLTTRTRARNVCVHLYARESNEPQFNHQ